MANYTEAELDALEPVKFFVPFVKALTVEQLPANAPKRIIAGIASTEDRDVQNETVLQAGMDFQPLLERGFINWNHQAGPENIIGQPVDARIVKSRGKSAFYVKGELFEGHARADAAWSLLQTLEKARASGQSDRRLGWSVEGGVLERRGNQIAKSVVRQLALTHEPVNYGTFAQLAKSMALANADLSKAEATSAVTPLLLQNMAGTRRKASMVRQALFGEQPDDCQVELGRFKKGRIGMFEHLVSCEGWAIEDARDTVLGLFKSLTT